MPWYEVGVTKWSTIAVEANSEEEALDMASSEVDFDELEVNKVYTEPEEVSRLHRHADQVLFKEME